MIRAVIAFLFAVTLSSVAFAQATCVGNKCPSGNQPYDKIDSVRVSGVVEGQNLGLSPLSAVQVATIAVLPFTPTFSPANGTLIATSNGALVINGYSVVFGDRVLVKNQALAYQNGIYTVVATGSGSAPYQMVRSADLSTSAQFFYGITTYDLWAGASWIMTTTGVINIGVTNNAWQEYTSTAAVTSGSFTPSLDAIYGTASTSAVVTITTAATTNLATVNWTANGLAINTPVCFTVSGGSLPQNVSACPTTYYVFATGTNSFTITGAPATGSGPIVGLPTSGSSSGTVTAYANPNQGALLTRTLASGGGSWASKVLAPPTPSLGQKLFVPAIGSVLTSNSDWSVQAANFFYTDQDPAMLANVAFGGAVTAGKKLTFSFNFGTTGKCAIVPGTGVSDTCQISYTPVMGDTLATVCNAISLAILADPDLYIGLPGNPGEITNMCGCGGSTMFFDWNGTTPLNMNVTQDAGGTITTPTSNNCLSANFATFTNNSPSIGSVGTNYAVNQVIVFVNNADTLPTGFTFGTFYYVLTAGLSANAFEVSATPGGTAITAGSAGSGTHIYRQFCTAFQDAGPLWSIARDIPNAQYGGFVRPLSGSNIGQLFFSGVNAAGQGASYATFTVNVGDPVAGTSLIQITSGGASGHNGTLDLDATTSLIPDVNQTSLLMTGSHTGTDATGDAIISTTLNTSGSPTVFDILITDTAHGGSSLAMQILGGAAASTNLMKLDLSGNLTLGGAIVLAGQPTFASSTTGVGTQTFTNSPCVGLTTAQWIPVTITGQTGTWNIPACK